MKTMGSVPPAYRNQFEALQRANSAPAWLRDLRQLGMSRFRELGFPTTRDEAWRFTDVTPIKETAFESAQAAQVDLGAALTGLGFDRWPGARMIFVNGQYRDDLSDLSALPDTVTALPLRQAIKDHDAAVAAQLTESPGLEDHPFAALNAAFIADGAYIRVPRGLAVEAPLNLIHLTTAEQADRLAHPRHLIVAEPGSKLTVFESFGSTAEIRYLTNAVTQVLVEANAEVDFYKIQRESRAAFHTSFLHVRCQRDSRFASHGVTVGGRISRNDLCAVLAESNCECTLNGLYVGADSQLIDNHTLIDHVAPNCHSYEIYKGILDGRARGVFNGKIYVHPAAQKTDAMQTNRALLLTDDACVNTKPELEIYADDVKCSHGATIGQLDEGAVFYLRSRGIGAREARGILTYAFACEALSGIRIDAFRAEIERELLQRFEPA